MRILVVTMELPPTSSCLGTLFGELAGSSPDVIFDFYGASPRMTSPVGESGFNVPGTLYDPGLPPLSRLLVDRRKVISLSDCFIDVSEQQKGQSKEQGAIMMHWGMVSPWRPINTFAEALASWNRSRPDADAYRKNYTSSSLRETWACSCVAGRFGSELAQKLSDLKKQIVSI